MMVQGSHTAPPGRESFGQTPPKGFTLGYFRLFPPGRTALNASLFPHLELLLQLLLTACQPEPDRNNLLRHSIHISAGPDARLICDAVIFLQAASLRRSSKPES
jgi:hypothetical protein